MRPGTTTASTLLTLALLTGCTSTRGPAPAPEAAAPDLSASVRWVADSAEYRAIFHQTYRLAGERLEAVVSAWDGGPWAVALDADETVISNAPYEEMLEERGVSHTSELWAEWVGKQAAPALPGALAFLDRVRALGGRIAIVTNRAEALCPDTEANLEAIGVPFDVVLCRPPGESEKEPRWRSVEDGTAAPGLPPLEIVLWLGDNIQDFPGLDQELRFEDPEAYGEFGERFFALPNPMYGSWTGN
jgi:5'-nucleotidase (lipoprotein e(P4) family)